MKLPVYIVICLIWGSTWLAIKIGLSGAPPLYSLSLRFLLAVGILWAIAHIKGYRFPEGRRRILKTAYPGLYMYGVSYALIYFAEQYIDSSLTAVLFGSFPFFVAALTHWRLKAERLTGLAWIGLVVGFGGVVLISYHQWQLAGDLFLGTLLALGGSYAAAHGIVLHKKHFVEENIVIAVLLQMALGGIPLVLAALVFESVSDLAVSLETVGSIIYLAVFGSVLAFLGYYWLLKRTTVVNVSLIGFVTPLVAIFFGSVLAEERLTLMVGLGTAMILSGILLVVRRSEKAAGPKGVAATAHRPAPGRTAPGESET